MMALHGQSLNAAISTGPGTAIHFDVPHAAHSLLVTVTGSPDQAIVHLEGTVDGSDWFVLGQVSSPFAPTSVGNFPVMSTRANLTTLTGGTSPTVTAWIAAA